MQKKAAIQKKFGKQYVVDWYNPSERVVIVRQRDAAGVDSYRSNVAFASKEGQLFTDFVYDVSLTGGFFCEGLALVSRDQKYGYVNRRGQEIIPAKYERASMRFCAGLAAVELDGKWGFVDSVNHVVIPFAYDKACDFSDSLVAVKQAGKWGVISRANRIVIPLAYDSVLNHGDFGGGVIGLVQNGKAGGVDFRNQVVIPFQYSAAESECHPSGHFRYRGIPSCYIFDRGAAFVKDDQCRIGAVNRLGELVIPVRYKRIFFKEEEGQIIAVSESGEEEIFYYPDWLALPDK